MGLRQERFLKRINQLEEEIVGLRDKYKKEKEILATDKKRSRLQLERLKSVKMQRLIEWKQLIRDGYVTIDPLNKALKELERVKKFMNYSARQCFKMSFMSGNWSDDSLCAFWRKERWGAAMDTLVQLNIKIDFLASELGIPNPLLEKNLQD